MGNLLFGILFVIGGLTRTLVLRGTTSSAALAVIGVVLCILGIVQLSRKPTAKTKPRPRSVRGRRTAQLVRAGRDARTTLPMMEPVRPSTPARRRFYSSSR